MVVCSPGASPRRTPCTLFARRFAGALRPPLARSRGSLAVFLARGFAPPDPLRASRAPLRRALSVAWLGRVAARGLVRPGGFAPPDPCTLVSRAASPARSVRASARSWLGSAVLFGRTGPAGPCTLSRAASPRARSRGSVAWLGSRSCSAGGLRLSSLTESILPAVLIAAASELPPIRASANIDITFADVTATAGLQTRIVYGASGENKYILETTGTGVFFDYDNDGRPDISRQRDNPRGFPRGQEPSNHLFRNNRHNGTFEDVTRKAGLVQSGSGQGVAVADYDNDGFDDSRPSCTGSEPPVSQQGDGTFEDVTARAGLITDRRWARALRSVITTTTASSILTSRITSTSIRRSRRCPGEGPRRQLLVPRIPVMCGPRGLQGERDRLYHNTGKGTFTDVTIQAGELDKDGYRGLGVAWGDINNDGYPDIVVANDAQPNLLYVNERNGKFREVALEAGIAVDEDGRERAGMGVDLADYNNDGWLDLAIANFTASRTRCT